MYKKNNGMLEIKVIDDGPGIAKNSLLGLGIAIQNIENRLKNLYGSQSKLMLVNADIKGAVAMIQIPLKV
jgi:sensor histidine kinase YesM